MKKPSEEQLTEFAQKLIKIIIKYNSMRDKAGGFMSYLPIEITKEFYKLLGEYINEKRN